MKTITNMPNEILTEVFSYIGPIDCENVAKTFNKRLHKAVSSEPAFQRLRKRRRDRARMARLFAGHSAHPTLILRSAYLTLYCTYIDADYRPPPSAAHRPLPLRNRADWIDFDGSFSWLEGEPGLDVPLDKLSAAVRTKNVFLAQCLERRWRGLEAHARALGLALPPVFARYVQHAPLGRKFAETCGGALRASLRGRGAAHVHRDAAEPVCVYCPGLEIYRVGPGVLAEEGAGGFVVQLGYMGNVPAFHSLFMEDGGQNAIGVLCHNYDLDQDSDFEGEPVVSARRINWAEVAEDVPHRLEQDMYMHDTLNAVEDQIEANKQCKNGWPVARLKQGSFQVESAGFEECLARNFLDRLVCEGVCDRRWVTHALLRHVVFAVTGADTYELFRHKMDRQ